MESCGAFAAVLPDRPTAPYKTSSYVLREWELALKADLPCLVVPDPNVDLSAELSERRGLVKHTDDAELLLDYAVGLSEEWRVPRKEPYVFFAADFGLEGKELRTLMKESIEAATGLPCRTGEYVQARRCRLKFSEWLRILLCLSQTRPAIAPMCTLRSALRGERKYRLRCSGAGSLGGRRSCCVITRCTTTKPTWKPSAAR